MKRTPQIAYDDRDIAAVGVAFWRLPLRLLASSAHWSRARAAVKESACPVVVRVPGVRPHRGVRRP